MDFSKLLQDAEQLTTEIEGNKELPRVERSLGQVLEASQELYSRVIQSGPNDLQANLLFGSNGIDLQQITQKLETLSSKKTLEPLQPIADTDIESFLKNERENAILSLIDEVNKNALQTVEDYKWEHMLSEWNQEKMKLMNAMIGPSQNWLDLKRMPEPMTPTDSTTKLGHSRLNELESAYACQVVAYNKLVFQGTKSRTTLLQKFAQTAEDFNDPKVIEMWEIIRTMSNIPPLIGDEDPLKSRGKPAVQNSLIAQGKKYLENRYRMYMTEVVNQNPHLAMRGGEPGTYPLVRSFVGLRLQGLQGLSDGVIEDRPLWPMVYYCLRCGDANAALHCLKKAGREHEELMEGLEEYTRYPERKLKEKLQTAINFQYRIQVRNASDPFKRAVEFAFQTDAEEGSGAPLCVVHMSREAVTVTRLFVPDFLEAYAAVAQVYCVIGSCDSSDEHSEVARTADDYLWLKLAVIRGNEEGNDADTFTYSDLQKMILEEYGETHYHAYEKPLVYFKVLALTGQFEPALEFLSRIPRYQVHGVHMALALHDLYLLGTPRNVQAPLLSVDTEDPPPLRRLNVARLLMLYVRNFEMSDPADALHYYYFLRKLKDPTGRNLFMCCCTDMAIDSRDYELLLGQMKSETGIKTPGLLQQFDNANIDARVIAVNVAEQLVDKGLIEDAVTVYDIADNLEKVVELLCTLLSQVVSKGESNGSVRIRMSERCRRAAARLRASGTAIPTQLHKAFETLTALLQFLDHFHNDNHEGALDCIRQCRIIPLHMNEVEDCVREARSAHTNVLRCLPAVLRSLATLLMSRKKGLQTHLHRKQLEILQEQAEALNQFAGTISYRMPGDTYSQLAQLKLMMQ